MPATAKTLLSMSGRTPVLPALSDVTVLIIDMQNEYLAGPLGLPGAAAATSVAADLLARARRAGASVVHIAHAGAPSGMFDRAGERGAFIDAVAPLASERVVEKRLVSAFTGTDLAAILNDLGGRPLVVMGFMTHNCVSSTVRSGAELGYSISVVADACATRDLPMGDALVSARTLNEAELAALGDRFARIVHAVDLQ